MNKSNNLDKGLSNVLLAQTKLKIKKKLKKEYNFTAEQIKQIFSLWSGKYKVLKKTIEDIEKNNIDVVKYTELGENISQILYEALISKTNSGKDDS